MIFFTSIICTDDRDVLSSKNGATSYIIDEVAHTNIILLLMSLEANNFKVFSAVLIDLILFGLNSKQ